MVTRISNEVTHLVASKKDFEASVLMGTWPFSRCDSSTNGTSPAGPGDSEAQDCHFRLARDQPDGEISNASKGISTQVGQKAEAKGKGGSKRDSQRAATPVWYADPIDTSSRAHWPTDLKYEKNYADFSTRLGQGGKSYGEMSNQTDGAPQMATTFMS